ncbi:MAG: Hpt domain-containing protein [Nitrospira sp. NTP1]|nr:Hpt domain-containing protein [Nitrospira sp. NTP1]
MASMKPRRRQGNSGGGTACKRRWKRTGVIVGDAGKPRVSKREGVMEAQAVMDLSAALDRLDGDQDLFLTLAELFVERSAQALDALQTALAAQDIPVLVKEAHKLKGSAMEFCARPAVAAAAHLEESARKAAVQDIPAAAEQARAEVQRLTAALVEIMEKGFPS